MLRNLLEDELLDERGDRFPYRPESNIGIIHGVQDHHDGGHHGRGHHDEEHHDERHHGGGMQKSDDAEDSTQHHLNIRATFSVYVPAHVLSRRKALAEDALKTDVAELKLRVCLQSMESFVW